MERLSLFACLALVIACTVGCDGLAGGLQPKAATQPKPATRKTAQVKPPSKPKVAKNSVGERPDRPWEPPQRSVGRAEELAVKKIATVIKASREVGPALVVWIIDRTPSGEDMIRDVVAAAQAYYESREARELAAGEGSPLLTAIVAFGDKVDFVLDPPTGDWQQVKAGFDAVGGSSGSREAPFTAAKQALEKYLPLRTRERRELVFVVVTDEAGDDPQAVEELIEPTRRLAIPVYVIGLPAPWGQTNPFAVNPKVADSAADDSTPNFGPESCLSERVDIENWQMRDAPSVNVLLVDSGFGPFALERLCRASRGQFLALRPGMGYGYRGVSARSWPTGDELRFDDKVLGKYAPDYVSEAEYRKLLTENKARAALCEAARLERVVIQGSPGSRFPNDADAKMARQLNQAQQFAAQNLPAVDRLYNTLAQGEPDRAALTAPRWQAEFDLAFGRAMANKVRLDGYNSMIAALKRGKSFQKPESKEWRLESADNFETESTIKRLADKSKLYLERVVQGHPGTPWAKIAEEELRLPLGWAWREE